MKEHLQTILENDFSFMKREKITKDVNSIDNIYRRNGVECGSGWFQLIYELCQAIRDRYDQEGCIVDVVPEQVKQKFGVLKFHFYFKDISLELQELYFIEELSIRFTPYKEDEDDVKKKLRKEIVELVKRYEEMSKVICESCGKDGYIRDDMIWLMTLCDACFNSYFGHNRVM